MSETTRSDELAAVSNGRLAAALRRYAFAMGLTGQGYPDVLNEAARRLNTAARRRIGVVKGRMQR